MGQAHMPTHPGPSGPVASAGNAVLAQATDQALARFPSFEHVLELMRKLDMTLLIDMEKHVRLASYSPGRIEFALTEGAKTSLPARIGSTLQGATGSRWAISVVSNCDTPTIDETRNAAANARQQEALAHPLVQAVIAHFPKAELLPIPDPQEKTAQIMEELLPEVEDEWDPFEED